MFTHPFEHVTVISQRFAGQKRLLNMAKRLQPAINLTQENAQGKLKEKFD